MLVQECTRFLGLIIHHVYMEEFVVAGKISTKNFG
jgi:hypothetical protein